MFIRARSRFSALLGLIITLALALTAGGAPLAAQRAPIEPQPSPAVPSDDFRSSPVMFIENAGQWPDAARFQVWGGPAGTIWLAEDAIWLTIVEQAPVADSRADRLRGLDPAAFHPQPADLPPARGVNIRLSFVGANPHPRIEPFDRLDTVVSYFIGNEPDQWRPAVPVWGGVRYVDLYPGVDLEITNEGGQMVQRLSAQPGADLSAVRLRVEGTRLLGMEGDDLRASTGAGESRLSVPAAEFNYYVEGLTGGKQTEGLAKRAGTDPVQSLSVEELPSSLLYSALVSAGYSTDIGVDAFGQTIIVGSTTGDDFPLVPGSYDTSYNGWTSDAFAIKLDSSGRRLLYATFLGGELFDRAEQVAVDANGNAYVVGWTTSRTFPTTSGAFDRVIGGTYDSFVAKINSTGTQLQYATYLGGSGYECYDWLYSRCAIAVDTYGSAYVTGRTSSTDFPTTSGALDRTPNGIDAYVSKLTPNGSGLVYSTYLGGSSFEYASGIAVDITGCAYVIGETGSSDFPTTIGAFNRALSGGSGVFVTKLNTSGSRMVYGTFLGHGSGRAIAVDASGNAIAIGLTNSADFPTTNGAFDTSYNGQQDIFVTKLNPYGSQLLFSTYLGGTGVESGIGLNRVTIDSSGRSVLAGTTDSADFPVTVGSFDDSYNGGRDTFISAIDPSGNALAYSTFLSKDSGAGASVKDAVTTGVVYVTGSTGYEAFPVTPGALNLPRSGMYVLKLVMSASTYTISGRVTDASGAGVPGVTVSAGSSLNTTTDANGNYTFTGLTAGTYNISPSRYLYAFSPASRTVTVPPNATRQDFVQTPVVDLSVDRIEVAQVFVEQNDPISGTQIPLIAGKDTLVRVYVGVSGATSVGGVTARLHIRQPDGTETVDSHPVNVWPVQARQTPDPYSLQDTVNFRPPAELLQGNVTFWADVDPENRIPETDEDHNTGGHVSKTFEAGESVRIAWTIVGYGSNPFTAIYPNLLTAASGDRALRRFYPVASGDVDYFFQPGIPPVVDVKFDTDEHHVLYIKKLTQFWEQVTSFNGWIGGKPDRLYGWISNEARVANGTCGAAAARYLGNWGGVAVGADYCDRSIGVVEPAVVFAHEIGHLLNATGLMHAPSSKTNPRCETAPDPDPSYPTLAPYPSASILAHGLDVMSSSVLWPDKTYDIMAYCKPSWISPYNYFKLKEGFDALANHQLQTVGAVAATPQLLVSGIVYTPSLNVTFDSFYALTSTAPPSNSTGSDYCLEMRSSTGAVLVHRCFDLSFKHPESGKPINLDGFVLRMPYPSGTKQVVLTHLSTPIAIRVVSAHAPAVRLLSPNGGENWAGSGTHTVTWTASDQDGDTLHFALAYSTDGGASWIPAGSDLTGTQHALDVSMLPGGTSVLLRISATDGVNTTDDVSDAPFTVGRKAPMAFILSPEDNARFFPGQAIGLEGRAFDLEDGALPDSAYRWTSNWDGDLGTGATNLVILSPGPHVITLRVTDSDGNRATATVRLWAGSEQLMPLILRGR